jgi:hypothetical protein
MVLEPHVVCARSFRRDDRRSPPVEDPSYTFLKQNEADPQNQYCSGQNCECEQHRKKFLHYEEIHFKPVRPACLLQRGDSCGTVRWGADVCEVTRVSSASLVRPADPGVLPP